MNQADVMVEYLMKFMGTPYIWMGNNPLHGFDCSGLVCEGLRSIGLIRRAEDLNSQMLHNKWPVAKRTVPPQRGDLLFFGKDSEQITHVAIAYSGGLMIEAGGGDSRSTTKEIAAMQNAFVRIRPISFRGDLVGTSRPPYETL